MIHSSAVDSSILFGAFLLVAWVCVVLIQAVATASRGISIRDAKETLQVSWRLSRPLLLAEVTMVLLALVTR